MAGYGHLFKDQAAAYAAFRPTYPSDLYALILKLGNQGRRDTALDIATGSGQAAKELAKHFRKVVAQDQSASQIKEAFKLPNVEYSVARAEETGLPDHSVDLVTVAQALHWFDLPTFYREARRVLRPDGAFAAWGYDLCEFRGSSSAPAANSVLQRLYNGTLGPYWSERRHLVETQYEGMEPGSEHFGESTRIIIDTMSAKMSVSALIGYLRSWSAYATYREQHPDLPDPLIQFKQDFMAASGFTSDDDETEVVWPLFVILARHPKPLP